MNDRRGSTAWWYVRAYPGHPDLMDEAARVLVPWLAARAADESATAWFFTRYWDMSGHHLRLRLACPPDGADRVHDRLPELTGLLRTLADPAATDRIVPGSVPQGLPLVRQVRCDLYAPELAKYGGTAGVRRAEELFTASTRLYADQRIDALEPLFARAALAVRYMDSVTRAALPDEGTRTAFWTAHRRQWGRQLAVAAPDQGERRRLLVRAAGGTAAAVPDGRRLEAVRAHVDTVVRTLDGAENDGNPVPRPVLLLHYLHMDLNRWGFVPAEESLLGVLAAGVRAGGALSTPS
ncbi:thiopeptide-type bacteriocin biosynthesis protein [Kitasatospora sp. NPDC093806]|uniref:thiopeptide-type bacteriocin biosynthesis protein n=1 Tax=Kitasatospora sp. NPDC093806 TaxID=3155075 RepID=UPI003436E6C6